VNDDWMSFDDFCKKYQTFKISQFRWMRHLYKEKLPFTCSMGRRVYISPSLFFKWLETNELHTRVYKGKINDKDIDKKR
jgi:hypothetical protein